MAERVIIFDTTLRDGEQSPGASMNTQEKVRLAGRLEKLGVAVPIHRIPRSPDMGGLPKNIPRHLAGGG